MPALAESYVDAPDDAARALIAVQYDPLNDFGGGHRRLGGGDAGPLVTVGAASLHFWLLATAFVLVRRSPTGRHA